MKKFILLRKKYKKKYLYSIKIFSNLYKLLESCNVIINCSLEKKITNILTTYIIAVLISVRTRLP